MSGSSYVLVADYFCREEDGDTVWYRRGATLTGLDEKHAENLLKVGAIAKASEAAGKQAVAEPGAEPVELDSPTADQFNQSTYITAAANSGIAPDDAASDDPPAKAATVEVWRKWAVDSGKLNEEEALAFSKTELQTLAK